MGDGGGNGTGGGHGGVDAGAADAGQALNGCTPALFAANDESAVNAPRAITFVPSKTPQPYKPPCMRIAKGEAVTWVGRFDVYPIAPLGGTTPTPIVAQNTGNVLKVTFAAPGTYGFASPAAPKVMLGAIEVTP
jgi:plastocyanin